MYNDIFQAINLSKNYGNISVLKEVNMTIHQGEIYGLIGENGAGKTTLMKIIGNLVRPTRGSISLFGQTDIDLMNQERKKIGYLIEIPALYSELSARDNLEFYCRIMNITDKKTINEVLHIVSLEDIENKKVGEFSLGMRQRLGLAIALINNPEFLVLDEPINGLDAVGISQIREILIKLAKENDVAVLISSHILSELQLLATKYGFIHKGRMLQEISAEDLIETEGKYISIVPSNHLLAKQILKDNFNIKVIDGDKNGEIRIPNGAFTLEEIISVLIRSKVEILSVSTHYTTLEDYFLNLIEGDN
ncbi:ABC transporter ATP-binding protein [Vallitalea guaymasensis]|uniref:ABC transporter ATP-binding protein n=1 Tax=Vallitalea guaymasensis TaxID=1185412 RepID=A0A8J8SBB2_9FIRM|nr:ABC transporter ATP-binding protein [Vallitalea guaymasensis]QUH28449.1 ABC transporter ATP-binding protein [Vallitalea guaymasensis]